MSGVKRSTTHEGRFWSRVRKTDACWLWTGGRSSGGYGAARSANGRQSCAHRVAYELSVGPIPEGLQVLHSCDNPSCVRPDHLFLGTQLDNMKDMADKGSKATGRRLNHPIQEGELNHNARITRSEASEVKRLYAKGIPQAQIARRLGISRLNVWNIVHGKSWRGA